MVIFAIFDVIGAMVLLISPEQIELEGCACAQIKALDKGNGSLYIYDAWFFCREREKCGKPDQRWWWPFLPFFS